MKRPRLSRDAWVWVFLIGWVLLSVFVTCLVADKAHAQIGGEVYSERTSTRPHGHYIIGWNTTGNTITDGTLVMADTSGATATPQIAMGKGFKTWTHVTTFGHAQRVLGVLMGNTPGYSQGRILVLGFHPWVKVDATSITAFSLMRPSLVSTTNGAMAAMTAADTTTITTPGAAMRRPIVGIFQRYANVDSLRGYVWVNTLGAISP